MIARLAGNFPRPLVAYRASTYPQHKYPKNSHFSDFMGLTEELRLFRKQLQK